MKKNLLNMIGLAPNYFTAGLKLILCFAVLALAQVSATAQNNPSTADKTISGKIVSASGEPLSGVTVGVKNSTHATTTDNRWQL